MASYDVTVDTRDMANKIDTVSHNVSNVKDAVIAMESAVILAEKQASDRVCKNLNSGFFALITTQIEQKNATSLSEAEAVAAELKQQTDSLTGIKKRMGDDFLILTERYSRLFNNMNVALHNRIYELEKPLMNFCEKDVKNSIMRVNNQIASVPVNQSESITVTQTIAAAHMKRNAELLIKRMAGFITAGKGENAKMKQIKLTTAVEEREEYAVPALLIVSDDDSGQGKVSVRLSDCWGNMVSSEQEGFLKERLHHRAETDLWGAQDRETSRNVSGEFETMMRDFALSTRVREMMHQLYTKNADWLTTKEG